MYLLDTAMVVYFNQSPQFDSQEMTIPLPADEVVWDAQTAELCANALGLNGEELQAENATGSRLRVQPMMSTSVKALLDLDAHIPTGSTNVYSKFILVHAIHVHIWKAQSHLPQGWRGASSGQASPTHDSGIHLGVESLNEAIAATEANEPALDILGYQPAYNVWGIFDRNAQRHLKLLRHVLDKWKRTWDADVAIQYPRASSASGGVIVNANMTAGGTVAAPHSTMRRFGFGRDAVPFYWLARALMTSRSALATNIPPDQRLVTILRLLKHIKEWVRNDLRKRGEPAGSVNDIDDTYGINQLTLDMKLFFTPKDKNSESPQPLGQEAAHTTDA
jgi:hypothetical protein